MGEEIIGDIGPLFFAGLRIKTVEHAVVGRGIEDLCAGDSVPEKSPVAAVAIYNIIACPRLADEDGTGVHDVANIVIHSSSKIVKRNMIETC